MYIYRYPHPAVTADCVVFGFDGRQLNVLLIERGLKPYKGMWALPGGFMKIDESLEECARRELLEETGVECSYLEQFHTYSSVNRDPRERVITVAFVALLRQSQYRLLAGDDAANASWFGLDALPPLAFDHKQIVTDARAHLKEVLKSRPVAFRLLDNEFTMPELQRLYEAINQTVYDRRNFAKKMLSKGVVVKSEESEPSVVSRSPIDSSAVCCDSMPPIANSESMMLGAPSARRSERNVCKQSAEVATDSHVENARQFFRRESLKHRLTKAMLVKDADDDLEADEPACEAPKVQAAKRERGRQGTQYRFDDDAFEENSNTDSFGF